jgi:peptide/nickel transport system permease protein
LGSGLFNTAVAIAVSAVWPMVRQLRASILTIKGSEYLEASKAFGAKNWYIILSHVIPHALAPMIVQVAMTMGNAITQIASLSFLGLGIQPPTPEWGNMLAEGKQYITSFWPMMFFPGLMVAICLLAFNMIGDGLRDALDPRMKR